MKEFLHGEYALSVLEQSLRDNAVSWYVAETDRPVGFMKVTWEAMLPETDKKGVLLNKLYLDPAETGKNFGQVMFNNITDMARSRGKDYLWLEVLEQNAGAHRFYQKQGMICVKNVLFETVSQQSILRIMGMPL
ncbi:GNAT family N-acetyltransferase [Enterobacter mori]|nr:GNAT family N-acetyltransferase [Enterobacter mori]MCG5128177.1 GNAT family N-acetyltransferase [Enterobacter mori]